MRDYPPSFKAFVQRKTKEYRFVVGIILDVDSIYLTSHSDVADVPGTVINGVLAEPIITSQRLRPDEARAEIGTATFTIVDLAQQFTDEVRERLSDSVGLRGVPVRFYFGFAGGAFADLQLVGTQKIAAVEYHDGRYSVECADIQRTMRADIFDPVSTTLSATLTAGDTTIQVSDTSAFEMVYHGESYTDAPLGTFGYVKVKNTVYRYSGKTSSTFTGCVPVFGTVAETITIDPALSADRRERCEEYIYLELPAVKLALAILTGDLYNDGASLPSHWSLEIPSEWITESDFINIGADLWNPATDAFPSCGRVLRFEGLKRTDAKAFLEKELYLALGLFSPIYADGSLGLRRMARIGADASHVAVLDNSNSVRVGALKHAMKSLRNVFRINWSWNGERFNRTNELVDFVSAGTHGLADEYERSFKGFHGSIHTDAAIFTMLDMLRDRYAAPPEEISVTVLDSLNGIEVGDVIRGRWRHVRDYAGAEPGANDPGIDRAFEVQSVSCNFRDGITLELFGSTGSASIQPPTQADESLPDDYYTSQGTALASAPGITIVGSTITAATLPLTGHADLTNGAAIYYHAGDLTLAAGVTLTITNNVQLRVRGFFQCNGTITGVGHGHAGVADDLRPLVIYLYEGIAHETIPGVSGYVGPTRGYDGVWFNASGVNDICQTIPSAFMPSAHVAAPVLALTVDGNSLLGLPTDLRGAGGPPGGRIESWVSVPTNLTTPVAPGGTGANGGAGLAIICRGMTLGANGLIDLSGTDSAPVSAAPQVYGIDSYPGAGGPGGPGTLYVLLDGAQLSLPDIAGKFRARVGTLPIPSGGNPMTFYQCTVIGGSSITVWPGTDPVTEPVIGQASPDLVSNLDVSGSALRIQYIPASTTPTPDTDSRPPPLSNLTATGVVGGIAVQAEAAPPEQWDVIEYYAAATNDRSGATLANRSRSTSFVLPFATATTRYVWGRTRAAGLTSDWYPASATGGVEGTSIEGGGGTPGESIEAQFATTDSGPWHSTFATGDLYMRTRVGVAGVWQGPWRIVGETGADGDPGDDGNFIAFIFQRSATQPATPTGNNPSGWTDAPPAYNGNPLWMSRATKTPAGILVGTWSTPSILAIDGEDGAPGLPGVQGPGLFSWTGAVNVSVTSSSITKTTGGTGYNAGAHSLESYSSGCFFSAVAGQTNIAKVVGFNDDPAVDAGISGINFGWQFGADGNCYSIQNGTPGASLGAYTASTVLSGIHDGQTIRLYKDGAQVGPEVTYTGRLFLDVSINGVGGSLLNVYFGPNGSRGPAGSTYQLASTAQAFTFAAGGVTPSPAGQSITFTVTRQNFSTASVWSTTPAGVTLTGSGDTRTLSVADFGSNSSVRVTATAGGFSDSITVVRLSQGATGSTGQAAMSGYLTNESHTLPADADGVVAAADLAAASGLFRFFEGVVDRSSAANYEIIATAGCTAQINTANNTPVVGQVRGFYRLSAITADQATVDLRASYSGVEINKRFTVSRARAGAAGDGQNLLPVDDWIVGTSGSQGPGNRWNANGTAVENVIVLGGAGTAPAGPFGTSQPLWECRSEDGTGTNGDGGWDVDVAIDHTKTYRSTVWFRVNQLSGSFYHGCRSSDSLDLVPIGGGPNGNPYFVGGSLPSLPPLQANKWYLSVGIVHGSGYTGGNSGASGIFDPESGRRLFAANEFRNATTATLQRHRAYHFYDASTATRQWMPQPRFEEINGSEPTVDQLLGFQRTTPWITRGSCWASATTWVKLGGASSWETDDIYSAVGYQSCHLQFKASQTNRYFMIGLSAAPAASLSYTNLNFAWYPTADGNAYIYESGSQITAGVPYTIATQFKISRDTDGTIRYYKDDELIRTTTSTAPLLYADSSFHTPYATANTVIFGPGVAFENIGPGDMVPGAVTRTYDSYVQNSLISPQVDVPATGLVSALSVTLTGQYRAPGSTTICIDVAFYVGGSFVRGERSPEVPCISSDVNVPTPIQYTFIKQANERAVITGDFSYYGGFPTPGATKFGFYSANLHVEDILR